jgi:hypothetical protein
MTGFVLTVARKAREGFVCHLSMRPLGSFHARAQESCQAASSPMLRRLGNGNLVLQIPSVPPATHAGPLAMLVLLALTSSILVVISSEIQ